MNQWNFINDILDEIKINSPDDPGLAKIIAFTNWGILRGLESFSQLITTESDENDNTVVSHHINQMIWIAQNICTILMIKQFISEKSKYLNLTFFAVQSENHVIDGFSTVYLSRYHAGLCSTFPSQEFDSW